eukprot:1964059-Pleurochrysis_carterae.AAC.1
MADEAPVPVPLAASRAAAVAARHAEKEQKRKSRSAATTAVNEKAQAVHSALRASTEAFPAELLSQLPPARSAVAQSAPKKRKREQPPGMFARPPH